MNILTLLISNSIVPFVLIFVGAILKRHPVTDMRSQNGYNTPVSRRSQKHWDYAQQIAPDIFISIGKWLLAAEAAVSIILLIFRVSVVISIAVGLCTGLAVLFGGFYYTDSKIEEFVDGQKE